jgi:hypothetical protein
MFKDAVVKRVHENGRRVLQRKLSWEESVWFDSLRTPEKRAEWQQRRKELEE